MFKELQRKKREDKYRMSSRVSQIKTIPAAPMSSSFVKW